jgi:TRAP-type C4-dicarboxylate transport system permease small subunit
MNTTSLVGVVLVIAGVLGLAYGGFSYTRETHRATVGSIQLSVDDDRRVNVPLWAAVAAIAAGGALLVVGRRRG